MLIQNALQTSQTSSPIVLKTVQQGHLAISILWDKQSQEVSGQVSNAAGTRDVALKGIFSQLSEQHLENAVDVIAASSLFWNGTTIDCRLGLQGGGSSSSKVPKKPASTSQNLNLGHWTKTSYNKAKQAASTSGNQKLIDAYNELDRIRAIKESITYSGHNMEMELFSLIAMHGQTKLIEKKQKLQDELLVVFDAFVEAYGGDGSTLSENHASVIHCLNTMAETQASLRAVPGQKEAALKTYEQSQSMFAKLNGGQKDPDIEKKIRIVNDPTAAFS